MRNPNPVGAWEGRRAIPPVTSDSGFARGRLLRCRRIRGQNLAGLLRTPGSRQAFRQGVQGAFQFVAVGFAQRRALAAIDDLIQFVQVDVDPSSSRHHWQRYSRKRGVRGKPRISLIGRLGLLV